MQNGDKCPRFCFGEIAALIMDTKEKKIVELLNVYMGLHRSRIEAYRYAVEHTGSHTLKAFFTRLADTSIFCSEQLTVEIYKEGGIPRPAERVTRPFFESLLQLNSALRNDRQPELVKACGKAEEALRSQYQRFINEGSETYNSMQLKLLQEHGAMLENDYGLVMNLSGVYRVAA